MKFSQLSLSPGACAAFYSGPDPASLSVVSMGRCDHCGHEGPGPRHECPAWRAGQAPALGTVRVVRGDCFLEAPVYAGRVQLVVADPPYGKILKAAWDVDCYQRLGFLISNLLVAGGTAYVWGGIGKPGHRPFFEWLARVEEESDLRLWDLITWKKKRAYGKKNAYLFVREECAMLVKGDEGPKTFHVPLLDKKRGYAGYNAKYPAKSEFYRRTNVWDDVTEILRGKIHDAEKPAALAEIMIRTSSNEGRSRARPVRGFGIHGRCGSARRKAGAPCSTSFPTARCISLRRKGFSTLMRCFGALRESSLASRGCFGVRRSILAWRSTAMWMQASKEAFSSFFTALRRTSFTELEQPSTGPRPKEHLLRFIVACQNRMARRQA